MSQNIQINRAEALNLSSLLDLLSSLPPADRIPIINDALIQVYQAKDTLLSLLRKAQEERDNIRKPIYVDWRSDTEIRIPDRVALNVPLSLENLIQRTPRPPPCSVVEPSSIHAQTPVHTSSNSSMNSSVSFNCSHDKGDFPLNVGPPNVLQKIAQLCSSGYRFISCVPTTTDSCSYLNNLLQHRLGVNLDFKATMSYRESVLPNWTVVTIEAPQFSVSYVVAGPSLSFSVAKQMVANRIRAMVEPVQRQSAADPDPWQKEDHYTSRSRQSKQGKLKKLERSFDNSNREARQPDAHSLVERAHGFQQFFADHGYMSHHMSRVPSDLVHQAIRNYISGYGLIHLEKLYRLNMTWETRLGRSLTPSEVPRPQSSAQRGARSRKIIYQAWRDFIAKSQGVPFIPAVRQGLTDEALAGAAKSLLADDKFVSDLKQKIGSSVVSTIKEGYNTVVAKVSEVFGAYSGWLKALLIFVVAVTVFLSILSLAQFIMVAKTLWNMNRFLCLDEDALDATRQGNEEEEKKKIETFVASKVVEHVGKGFDLPGKDIFTGVNAAARFTNSLTSLAKFGEAILSLIMRAIDWCCERVTGVPYFSDSKQAHVIAKAFESFYVQVQTIRMSDVRQDPTVGQDFIKAYNDLVIYFRSLHKPSLSPQANTRLSMILHSGNVKVNEIIGILHTSAGRVLPVWTNFQGPPEQGKSLLTKGLLEAVFQFCTDKPMNDNQIFNRNVAEDFWSGYHHDVFGVIYDDLLQNKDVTLRNKEVWELIQARNNCTYPLNMADIVDKGCTFFTSDFVTSSSNDDINQAGDLGIKDPLAFVRRCDFNISVMIKDPSKRIPGLSRLTPEAAANYDMRIISVEGEYPYFHQKAPSYTVNIKGKIYTIPAGIPITFQQLVFLVLRTHIQNYNAFKTGTSRPLWKKNFSGSPPGAPPFSPNIVPPQTKCSICNQSPCGCNKADKVSIPNDLRDLPEYQDFYDRKNAKNISTTTTTTVTATSTITTLTTPSEGVKTTDVLETIEQKWSSSVQLISDWFNAPAKVTPKPEVPTLEAGKIFSMKLMSEMTPDMDGTIEAKRQGLIEWIRNHPDLSAAAEYAGMAYSSLPGPRYFMCNGTSTCHHMTGLSDVQRLAYEFMFLSTFRYDNALPIKAVPWKCPYSYLHMHSDLLPLHHFIQRNTDFYVAGLPHLDTACNMVSWEKITYLPMREAEEFDPTILEKIIAVRSYELTSDDRKQQLTAFAQFNTGMVTEQFAANFSVEKRQELSSFYFGTPSLCKTKKEYMDLGMGETDIAGFITSNAKLHPPDCQSLIELGDMIRGKSLSLLAEHQQALSYRYEGVVGGISWASIGLIVSALTAALALTIGATTTGWFSGTRQSEDKNSAKMIKQLRKRAPINRKPTFVAKRQELEDFSHDVSAIRQADQQAMDVANCCYQKAIVWCRFSNAAGKQKYGFMFLPRTAQGVVMHHIVAELGIVTAVDMFYNVTEEGEWRTRRISDQRIDEKRDLHFLTIELCDQVKDLVHHLRSNGDGLTSSVRMPVRLSYDSSTGYQRLVQGTIVNPYITVRMEDGVLHSNCLFARDCEGAAGECSLPYVLFNSGLTKGKIIGLHAGASTTGAVIMPLYQEDFGPLKKGQTVEAETILATHQGLEKVVISHQDRAPIRKGFRYYSSVNIKPPQPQKSQLEKTAFATGIHTNVSGKPEWWPAPLEVNSAPAVLKKTVDGKDPHLLAYRKKIGKISPLPPPEVFEPKMYTGCFSRNISEHDVFILTLRQAIFGWPEKGIPPIDLKTSPGFPWILLNLTREDLIDVKTQWIDPRLVREVTFIYDCARKGIVVPHVTTHCLKDELRDLDRVAQAYTRAFQIGNLQMLIFHRMVFSFWVFQTEHQKDSPVQVGINPYSSDWDLLANLLATFPDIISRDTSAWDLGMPDYFAQLLADSVSEAYSPRISEEHVLMILVALQQTIVIVVLMPDGHMYTMYGMGSGTFGTSFINSVVNTVIIRTVYYRCQRNVLPADLYPFEEHAHDATFGDDNSISKSHTVTPFYNGETVTLNTKKMYDWDVTAPDKTSETRDFTLEENIFLSRGFKKVDGFWVSPLKLSSIIGMTQWVRKSSTVSNSQQMRINMQNALRELAYYSQEEYEKYQKLFNQFLRACHLSPILETHADARSFMLAMKQ